MDDVPSSRKWMIRSASGTDLPFLRKMLYTAAFWRPNQTSPLTFEEALLPPEISRYVEGWGRPSDTAFVAVDMDFQPIGAAWFRLFDPATPGYGFVDPSIPEVTIAVIPDWRG